MYWSSINAPLCPFLSVKAFGEEELSPPTILSHSFQNKYPNDAQFVEAKWAADKNI